MARSRPKVLIVDDDPATRDGLTALLENWGYSASSAEDGKTALKLCEKELPHAIVTDLMMPGMNGIEFIQGLQRTGAPSRRRHDDRPGDHRNRGSSD